MPGFRDLFNQTGFLYDRMGIISGTSAITQFPDHPCSLFRLKAFSDNKGSFFIGTSYNTGSATLLPWELDAGQEISWSVSTGEKGFNLNNFYYRNASGSSDRLSFWVQK